MNLSSVIFLVNRDVRAVAVSYETGPDGKGAAPFYTFKTLDPSLKVGDAVVIPTDTRHKMTVARVEAVDVEIDFDSSIQLKWIISKVDDAAYRSILEQEAAAIEAIKSAEARAKREELARKLMADNPDLKDLSIVNATSDPALPAPEAA